MSASPAVPNKIAQLNWPQLSNFETGITAKAGGGQSSATKLTAQVSWVDTVASGNDSVKLPPITNKPGTLGSVGTILFVGNNGANSMQVYGASPDKINGVATGTGVAVAAGVNVWFAAVKYASGGSDWLMTNSQAAAVAAITSGTIAGVAITNSSFTGTQGAPATATDSATITAANILTGIIAGTPTAAANYTLPTGILMEGAATWATNESFDWSLINLATTDSFIITLLAGTGHTIVGDPNTAADSATTGVLYGATSRWRTRKTALNTFVTYRIS